MAPLIGRHLNKIDKKGRISVPKPFRCALETEVFNGIYAYLSFKYPAIEACGAEFMQQLSESLAEETDMFSDDQDDLAAVILENAHQLSFDPEGRVVLPPELVAHAGLDGEAIFVGRGRQFFIWEPEAYAAHAAKARDRARLSGATLRVRTRASENGRDA